VNPLIPFDHIADDSIAFRAPSREITLAMLKCSDAEFPALFSAAAKVRHHFHGKQMSVQVLSNAKSGLCPEDCHYCSQSKVSDADIARYPLKPLQTLLEEAKAAKANKADHFCMGLSGRAVKDKEVDALCEAIGAIKKEVRIDVCCTLGFMTPEQARRLRSAGLDRLNHNLNTSERHYPKICTTHTYAQRRENLMVAKDAGLELCSGGIVGQGETDEDIADMLLALRELEPKSVPINFLIPVCGTPFAQLQHKLTPIRCLKVLAVARLIHPTAELRVAGGREHHLRSLQPMALFIVNSMFINGYLTEGGDGPDVAFQMIADAGFEVGAEELAALRA
jgi:biotin synthase